METAQQQRDDNLETESKNIVEAINEINSKTIEKVDQVQLKSEISKVNQTIAIVNSNLVTSISVLNQNVADGFNTINGGINNEIRPAIKANNDAITKEISDRDQENKNIRSEFTEEDSKLQNTINSIKTELQESINTESSERKSADTILSDRIAIIEDADYQTGTEVNDRINEIVGAAPEALDTLKEIADALNNDPDFAATITNQLSKKVDKVNGKQLSTNDYTTAEKEKLAGLENYDDSNILNQLQQTETGVAENLTEIEKLQSGKQNILVSGENIKTINGKSILGSGNLVISQDLSSYQTKSDETLSTTDKTITGAINEVRTNITTHIADKENPHNVTKAQLGLENVDNTSDVDKPISIAIQTALDGKQAVGNYALTNQLPIYTTVPELTASYTIPANATNVEHIYFITIGATVYNITGAEGIKWLDGIAPAVAANSTLVVSVVNNLAVWGIF